MPGFGRRVPGKPTYQKKTIICGLLGGAVGFGAGVVFVEAKLPLLPRYFQPVVPAPFGLGLPTWEYDLEFDLNRHLREVMLKHGSDVELKALAGTFFSQVMDRRHPLWDITVVRGLRADRTGLIFRLHHRLADALQVWGS